MARYRKVDPRIWNDAKFMKLGHLGQMMFLYILTHPNMTMIGMLRSKKEALAFERGWDLQALNEAFDLGLKLGLLEYHEVGLICLPNFIKYNEPESVTVVKSWHKCLDFLPECDLREKYLDKAYQYCKNRGEAFEKAFIETIGKPSYEPNCEANCEPNGEVMPYQITESRKQKNTNKHLSLNSVEDEAPAPVDVCDEFENPFFDEPPFEFEPDGQCFDAPFGQLIDESNLENNREVIKNQKHVLTTPQLVVLGKTWGVSIGHTPRVEDIANRGTLTVEMAEKVIKQYKAKNGTVSSGYLIECLDRASRDPDAYFGNVKKKEITAETMTDAQRSKFAKALVQRGRWLGKNKFHTWSKSEQELEADIRNKLRDPQIWESAKVELQNLGLIAKEA